MYNIIRTICRRKKKLAQILSLTLSLFLFVSLNFLHDFYSLNLVIKMRL